MPRHTVPGSSTLTVAPNRPLFGDELVSKAGACVDRLRGVTHLPMAPTSATKKLFHVIVVAGMGTAAACSSSTSPTSSSEGDAMTQGSSSGGSTSGTASGSMKGAGMDAGHSCAGWAPCC